MSFTKEEIQKAAMNMPQPSKKEQEEFTDVKRDARIKVEIPDSEDVYYLKRLKPDIQERVSELMVKRPINTDEVNTRSVMRDIARNNKLAYKIAALIIINNPLLMWAVPIYAWYLRMIKQYSHDQLIPLFNFGSQCCEVPSFFLLMAYSTRMMNSTKQWTTMEVKQFLTEQSSLLSKIGLQPDQSTKET